MTTDDSQRRIPIFGARKMARALLAEVGTLETELNRLKEQLTKLGAMSALELEARRGQLEREIEAQTARLQRERRFPAQTLQRWRRQ